jgi:hypothetical protein
MPPFETPQAEEYRHCLERLRAGDDDVAADCFELGDRFDELVDGTAGNSYLAEAVAPIRMASRRLRRLARYNPARLGEAGQQRIAVAEAIALGDTEAAAKAEHARLQGSLENALLTLSRDLRLLAVTPALVAVSPAGEEAPDPGPGYTPKNPLETGWSGGRDAADSFPTDSRGTHPGVTVVPSVRHRTAQGSPP